MLVTLETLILLNHVNMKLIKNTYRCEELRPAVAQLEELPDDTCIRFQVPASGFSPSTSKPLIPPRSTISYQTRLLEG